MAEKLKDNRTYLSTKLVKEITNKENLGIPLKNHEKLWFKNIRNVRKANLTFAMTNKEVNEYLKSKLSVHYFAQKYCQIKLEDGTIGHMKLRDYQKDIIDLYVNNRFSILMASRQVGKCLIPNTLVDISNENNTYTIPLFEIYYDLIRQERKLLFIEKLKLFLYRLHDKF